LKKLKKMKENKQKKKRLKVNPNFLELMFENKTNNFMIFTHDIDNWKFLLEQQIKKIIDIQNIDYEKIKKSLVSGINSYKDPQKSKNYEEGTYDQELVYFHENAQYNDDKPYKYKDNRSNGNQEEEKKNRLKELQDIYENQIKQFVNLKEDKNKITEKETPTETDYSKRYVIYKVKQRMMNFSLKTFGTFDLKNIIEYWIKNAKNFIKDKVLPPKKNEEGFNLIPLCTNVSKHDN